MKKIIVSMVTLLVIICMAGCSYAEEVEKQFKATIEISSNVTEASVGDKVTFTFVSRDIENSMLDGKVGGIEGTVTYDKNFFEYDSCNGFEYNPETNKLISFNFTAEGGTNGTFTLKVKDGAQGTATVTFSNLIASDGRDTANADTLGASATENQAFTVKIKKAEDPTPPADDKTNNTTTEQENKNETTNKNDTSTGTGKLPQTGLSVELALVIIAVVIIGILAYSKYNKLRDIK